MNPVFWTVDILLYLFVSLSVIYKILELKTTNKIYVVFNVITIIILMYSSFVLKESQFAVIYLCAHTAQVFLLYAATPKLQMFSVITLYFFIYFINSIVIVVINSLVPLSITTMTTVELFIHIVVDACIIFCCFNNKIRYKIQQILFVVPKKIKILLLFAFGSSTILMTLICSSPDFYLHNFWSIAVRFSLIFFSLFIFTVIPILIITVLTNTYLKKQNENFERELQAQAEHYIALAESNKELRRFKHDFKNLRIGIAKALSSGDNEIALEMIENGQNDFIQATDNILKFNTGNGIVDAILTEKQKKAASYNTNIVFEGMIPQTGFAPTDLCVIFGNTLDNAIEACEKISNSDDNIISLSVNCSNGFIFITITNPVAEKVVTYKNHIETTKKDRTSHGFGLYSLQKIAKKYDGEMSIISEEHTFTLTLELCL